MLIIIGFMTFVLGLQADIIAANRKILEDVQYRVRRMEASYSSMYPDPETSSNEKKRAEKDADSDIAGGGVKEAD